MTSVAMNGSVLSIDGLSRRFGSHVVVRDLDLDLSFGERVGLWGPNGSGKSTVLRCIAGTLLPSEGAVRVCGHTAGTLEARALVGASLSQERSFDMRLTGHANLLFFARLRFGSERDAERRVAAVEEELERPVHQGALGGPRRRGLGEPIEVGEPERERALLERRARARRQRPGGCEAHGIDGTAGV